MSLRPFDSFVSVNEIFGGVIAAGVADPTTYHDLSHMQAGIP